MPRGYPDSVSGDYLAYQCWDTMQVGQHIQLCAPLFNHSPCPQAFCSSITGALATLAILKGVGVGDSDATPLAAALTWMLKGEGYIPDIMSYHVMVADGTGMLGRILFGWMVA